MIPLILVAIGGYFIADSILETEKFKDGGETDGFDFNKLQEKVKSGDLIIDKSGILKSYAWHTKDGKLEVTSKDKTGSGGHVYQEYSIKLDGKEILTTREYKDALKYTQKYFNGTLK